jgi:hypothetical protein
VTGLRSASRRSRAPVWVAAGLCAMVTASAGIAAPAPSSVGREAHDGVYGRFDGDIEVGFALGAELEKDAARAAARATVHYFSVAGMYASYRDAFNRGSPDARLVSLGLDLRPLFIPRWSQGWEDGPALLDLMLDSAALSLGAYWGSSAPEARSSRGLELGLGFGVPLFTRASGPWLGARGLMRWPEPMLGGHVISALATLEWHGVMNGPWL